MSTKITLYCDRCGAEFGKGSGRLHARPDGLPQAHLMSTKPFRQPSPCCGATRTHSRKWDAYYCRQCHAWLEPPCGCTPDEHCPYSEHTLGPRPQRMEWT